MLVKARVGLPPYRMHTTYTPYISGMQSHDIFGLLWLQGSISAPAPARSKTVWRLRLCAKCTASSSGDQLPI